MLRCWGAVGIFFNWFVKRRFKGWWLQYNYITSAALDSGLIMATIVIFFGLYLTKATAPDWFGNFDALSTLDMAGAAVQQLVPYGEIFGPSTWV